MALMEAIIDFSEDEAFEVPLHSIAKNLMALREEIAGKLSNRVGETIRNGIQITLVGAPNAGKSSFMNLISERKVSIVSAMPGTTRDVISTLLNMNGFLVRMSDTAGLRESSDPIEMEGIEMTCESVEKSDFIFFIVDSTNPSCQYEHILNDPRTIVLYNKIDLLDSDSLQELKRSLKNNEFLISCSSKEGFNEFLQKLPDLLKKNYALSDDLISQHRHKVLLKECIAQLSMFEESVEDVVLAAEHLRYAASAIGKITGIIDTEEILSVIFKEFCIGK